MLKIGIGKLCKCGIAPGEKGFTLIEVLIAIVLTSIIVPCVFLGIQTMTKIFVDTNTQEIAKDIAASDMDWIMSQPYASRYTIFNPNSGPVGTVTMVVGSGWGSSETISNVTVGGTIAAYTLSVDSSGNISGGITVPLIGIGGQPIVISGSSSGNKLFNNAFMVTTTPAQSQPPVGYSQYTVSIAVTSLKMTEQQITINIELNGNTVYTLTDYRTAY